MFKLAPPRWLRFETHFSKTKQFLPCGPQKMNSDGLITLHAPGARIRGAGQQELRSPRSGNSWELYDARSESPLLENFGQAYPDQDWNRRPRL
jgi:hypothetical protein